MKTNAARSHNKTVTNPRTQEQNSKAAGQLGDNRRETLLQRKLHHMANIGATRLASAQRSTSSEEEELLQGKFKVSQKNGPEEEELQMKAVPYQKGENNTGLPDTLKSGIEKLSGYPMDDVKVHYNSSQPAQLNAHAYARGTDIHLAPGQEKHLPHEAWHVVQQMQGRVKPTFQMKGTVLINDDVGLEREADMIGEKAMQMRQADKSSFKIDFPNKDKVNEQRRLFNRSGITKNDKKNSYKVIQRLVGPDLNPKTKVFIQRTTERELHNAEALIVRPSENINSYVVQVLETGQIYTLRYDQLSLEQSKVTNDHPLDVKIGEITGRNNEDLKNDAIEGVSRQLGLKPGSFVLGGSFAVLIHAFEQGESARTPRDIDVLVNSSLFYELKRKYDPRSGSDKPFSTKKTLWGIPIEIHLSTKFGVLSDEEQTEGIQSKNSLLRNYLTRLTDLFGAQVSKAKEGNTALKLLTNLEALNKEALESKKEDAPKLLWIKTLEDIRNLVNSGAENVMEKEESGFNWALEDLIETPVSGSRADEHIKAEEGQRDEVNFDDNSELADLWKEIHEK